MLSRTTNIIQKLKAAKPEAQTTKYHNHTRKSIKSLISKKKSPDIDKHKSPKQKKLQSTS